MLASFTGALDGKPAEITLSRYTDTVEATAFDVPAEAKVVDNRTATS